MFTFDLIIFFTFLIFLLLIMLTTNSIFSLNTLILSELVWITIFILYLCLGYYFNNLTYLSLTFFILVISSVEIGSGLLVIMSLVFFKQNNHTTNKFKINSTYKSNNFDIINNFKKNWNF